MAFLTPEEIKAIRSKGSKVVRLESIDKDIRLIKMSSSLALEAEELQEDVKSGKKNRSALMLFMMQHACTTLEGEPLTEPDARALFELLPLSDISLMVNEIAALMGGKAKVIDPNAEPAPELTPLEKKE